MEVQEQHHHFTLPNKFLKMLSNSSSSSSSSSTMGKMSPLRKEEMDTVFEGWLIKSPPMERQVNTLFKSRWRRRFFVLSTDKNGGYHLQYYSDECKKKLKGSIPLEECEQVDSGLTIENSKQKYDYMFDIKTPGRIYYLAVDTYDEMSKWVSFVCNACGLRASVDDDDDDSNLPTTAPSGNQQEVTNNNPTISSPYILISDCISGPPTSGTSNSAPSKGSSSSIERNEKRSNSVSTYVNHPGMMNNRSDQRRLTDPSKLELSNYDLGDDSVFEGGSPTERNSIKNSSKVSLLSNPPRPPKPPHLVRVPATTLISSSSSSNHSTTNGGDNYANTQDIQEVAKQQEFSQNSKHPPSVSRNLKPGRKQSTSPDLITGVGGLSIVSQRDVRSMTMGPPVQRTLKPKNSTLGSSSTVPRRQWPTHHNSSSADEGSNSDSGSRRNSTQEEQIYFYLPPVGSGNGQYPTMMIPAESFENQSIAYIDLELPDPTDPKVKRLSCPKKTVSSTVYKTVDFVKTDAFNRTRQKVEEKYDEHQNM